MAVWSAAASAYPELELFDHVRGILALEHDPVAIGERDYEDLQLIRVALSEAVVRLDLQIGGSWTQTQLIPLDF